MKKYTVIISGHKKVLARNEEEAFKIVDAQLKTVHPSFNLKSIAEL
jgi:hypothetical protein